MQNQCEADNQLETLAYVALEFTDQPISSPRCNLRNLGFPGEVYDNLMANQQSAFGPAQKNSLEVTIGHLQILLGHQFTIAQLSKIIVSVGGTLTIQTMVDLYETLSTLISNDLIARMANYINGYKNLEVFITSRSELCHLGFSLNDIAQISCAHGGSSVLESLRQFGKKLIGYNISREEIKQMIIGKKCGAEKLKILADHYPGLIEAGCPRRTIILASNGSLNKDLKNLVSDFCDDYQNKNKENNRKRKYTSHDSAENHKNTFFKQNKTSKPVKVPKIDDDVVSMNLK